eukprot:CAMPEP_0168347426 /NCGR_PEP_ID=MMETSP0213-20121227/18991_1 /TAXON_ID=151035 /ORGANISM="Euplotes harpa, Strain FSP1.4" /LENGTH=94 /DNA_ID=CAMNT_0008356529 /DNA_START=252 /DNA_END=536 /DNA_ORIENTATION=+
MSEAQHFCAVNIVFAEVASAFKVQHTRAHNDLPAFPARDHELAERCGGVEVALVKKDFLFHSAEQGTYGVEALLHIESVVSPVAAAVPVKHEVL